MFDFETREQREAWRVIERLAVDTELASVNPCHAYVELAKAAARFDEREETCGIEPLSYAHAMLIVGAFKGVSDKQLDEFSRNCKDLYSVFDIDGLLNPKGRAVLAKLNAMCKVTQ